MFQNITQTVKIKLLRNGEKREAKSEGLYYFEITLSCSKRAIAIIKRNNF